MVVIVTPLNWSVGWMLILLGFLSGALIGIGFHRDGFLGGYASLRRRMLRLGHIACVALGVINILYSFAPAGSSLTSILFIVGGVTMPSVCCLCAWRERWRVLFPLPVIALVTAVVFTLVRGIS